MGPLSPGRPGGEPIVAPAWSLPSGPEVVVAVLHKGDASMDWARMYHTLQVPGKGAGTVPYVYSSHLPYDVSRNAACQAALDQNADWLFFLDSDVIPRHVDAIQRLARHNLPIVQGLYHSKLGGNFPFIMRRQEQAQPDGSKKLVFANVAPGSWTPGELVPVDTVATGCLLVHRRVLQAFKDRGIPWFEWTLGRRGRLRDLLEISDGDLDDLEALLASKEDPVLRKIVDKLRFEAQPEGLSEDFDFGWKAKQLGFPLHVDTSVLCDHVTQARIVGPGQIAPMETP